MTVKELKEELEYYDEDANVIFNFDDPDVEVESWTENKYGYKTVRIDCNLEPSLSVSITAICGSSWGRRTRNENHS